MTRIVGDTANIRNQDLQNTNSERNRLNNLLGVEGSGRPVLDIASET
jgi:hypothetical protein